jgi:uncharacterized surface protein with fasciclin (FAS1) repeats
LAQECCQGKDDLFLSVEPCGETSLSPAVLLEQDTPANPSSKGSEKIVTYKEKHSMANIFETARAEHQYNKFVSGIASLASLVDTLSGPGPFTIFVPNDAAFDRLSSDQQANLIADPEKLARVLKYHIVPGYYTADDLLDRLFLKTLSWERLRVWSDISMVPLGEEETDIPNDALSYITKSTVTTAVRESITINGAHVIRANIIADNGIMHVIDEVLIPAFTAI